MASSQILPVILGTASAGGDTVYASSRSIGFPYVIRGLSLSNNNLFVVPGPRVLAALRTTAASTGDLAAWNAGTSILAPFSADEELPVGNPVAIQPLWLPIDSQGSYLIARFVNAALVATDLALVVHITPAADLDALYDYQAPANPTGDMGDLPGCNRVYRPPIQGPDGIVRPGAPICLDRPVYDSTGRVIGYE